MERTAIQKENGSDSESEVILSETNNDEDNQSIHSGTSTSSKSSITTAINSSRTTGNEISDAGQEETVHDVLFPSTDDEPSEGLMRGSAHSSSTEVVDYPGLPTSDGDASKASHPRVDQSFIETANEWEDMEEPQTDQSRETISLQDLATKWMHCQNGSKCSNRVADRFFKLAVEFSGDIERIKLRKGGKIPSLTHLRKSINKHLTKEILIDYKFHDLSLPKEEREENAVYVVNSSTFPKKKYPSDKYELIYQVTKVYVSHILNIIFETAVTLNLTYL